MKVILHLEEDKYIMSPHTFISPLHNVLKLSYSIKNMTYKYINKHITIQSLGKNKVRKSILRHDIKTRILFDTNLFMRQEIQI